ncbi:uncharacterized protein THITE_2053822 [Thermothielavioides terrestris NRRL 8126]|uniref:RNase T2-like C-terminal domain-containing protein n=1 Tax=Thermothielavioides terrestris (strain ATCC 38088 / NRRL 8126) TaxID=578455 RepID=G2RAF5_THETT|nr:uncharacterized protein THITE_2053822 [Thermothielavioides terrestris NRRL 8126]AEO69690.1 hypothetical protein THITE_2053822 [Thermothielavioides terrestris NRRL 8126]
MLPQTLLLALSALFTAAAADTPQDFTGLGEIRTLYIWPDHPDLGCLTSAGQWTTNETLCGSFTTQWTSNLTFYLSATATGSCGIDGATFRCGDPDIFGTPGGTGGPIPGHDILRYGQYGIMAADADDAPPAPQDPPLDIHFYTGSEKGKYVFLGWKHLDDDEDNQ